MRLRIVRPVPGVTHGRRLSEGDTVDLPDGLAVSLAADGYGVLVDVDGRSAAADTRETATARRPGRPRRVG
ncbi:hypothetical protein QTQ03_20405 [Micromonospora sp. WMMA1363]|uniref:hypothetical protein n=1 Tax=Micromonospora sp. WMMA1363 TaxID=3053985 RepID=UPI00259C7BFE|nr:hypothetical protein [Micromonospora sp. WMMA1363]MDM4721841.1 hypothetical protein [Micromonospora sp. WMMA1363]